MPLEEACAWRPFGNARKLLSRRSQRANTRAELSNCMYDSQFSLAMEEAGEVYEEDGRSLTWIIVMIFKGCDNENREESGQNMERYLQG